MEQSERFSPVACRAKKKVSQFDCLSLRAPYFSPQNWADDHRGTGQIVDATLLRMRIA